MTDGQGLGEIRKNPARDKRNVGSKRADDGKGSQWDHDVLDAETKLLVSLVIGPRSQKNAYALPPIGPLISGL